MSGSLPRLRDQVHGVQQVEGGPSQPVDSRGFGVRRSAASALALALAQRWKRPALPFRRPRKRYPGEKHTPPTPVTNVVDISRAKAKAAPPIVKTSNIAELNQTLAGSSPNPWAQPPGW